MLIYSFKPIIHKDSRILILGSMPGAESLRKHQYYGNKNNQFWKILYSLFNAEISDLYSERVDFLNESKIALWDILENCERKGSLDKDIINEKPNDILRFLNENPQIHKIYCNGNKTYKSLIKHFPEIENQIECIVLPSSSPAYTIKFHEKIDRWKVILDE